MSIFQGILGQNVTQEDICDQASYFTPTTYYAMNQNCEGIFSGSDDDYN